MPKPLSPEERARIRGVFPLDEVTFNAGEIVIRLLASHEWYEKETERLRKILAEFEQLRDHIENSRGPT